MTRFTCFIKLNISKRKSYKKVHELSEICREILSSSIDVGFDLNKIIFITNKTGFVNGEWEIQVDVSRRKFHTEKYKFYDTTQNKIHDVEVFIPYKQLQNESFKFYNSKLTDIPESYTIRSNENRQTARKRLGQREKRNLSGLL